MEEERRGEEEAEVGVVWPSSVLRERAIGDRKDKEARREEVRDVGVDPPLTVAAR